MKKIIAFSVLLALLSFAVFAQDGSGWKIGFSAQLVKDLIYTTKADGKGEVKTSTSPSDPGDGTETTELGKYIKGSSNLFTYTDNRGHDQRLILSLTNSGEHHHVYIDTKIDNDWITGGVTLFGADANGKPTGILNGGAADWDFTGDTGASGAPIVFEGKVGTGRYSGFVPVYEIWDDYVADGGYNFFGVQKKSGFLPSDNISATRMDGNPWQPVYALSAKFGDFRLAIGSTLASYKEGPNDAFASKSAAEFGTIISGRPVDFLSFDLFYAIHGKDDNTAQRGEYDTTNSKWTVKGGAWDNLIGAYVGLDLGKMGVNGLGVSVGYTANFTASERAQIDVQTNPAKDPDYKDFDITNPLWSGIDINVQYNGIDKLGVNFNNNISFAGVKGGKFEKPGDNWIIGLDGNLLAIGDDVKENNQNWFAYKASLKVTYGLTDNLTVGLALRDTVGVFSTDGKSEYTGGYSSTYKTTTTTNHLLTTLFASYGVGNVSFGLGLELGVDTTAYEGKIEQKGTGWSYEKTTKGNLNTTVFQIPIVFKVSI